MRLNELNEVGGELVMEGFEMVGLIAGQWMLWRMGVMRSVVVGGSDQALRRVVGDRAEWFCSKVTDAGSFQLQGKSRRGALFQVMAGSLGDVGWGGEVEGPLKSV